MHFRLRSVDPRFWATEGSRVDDASKDAAISASWLAKHNTRMNPPLTNINLNIKHTMKIFNSENSDSEDTAFVAHVKFGWKVTYFKCDFGY